MWRAWQADAGGQAAVEAAILIPMLLFLMAGIFVSGLWLNATLTATAAVREGARSAALTGDCAAIIASVKTTMDAIDTDKNGERIKIEILPDPLPSMGHDVSVRVEYLLPILFQFFKNEYENAAPGSYPLGTVVAAATARMEVDPLNPNQACL